MASESSRNDSIHKYLEHKKKEHQLLEEIFKPVGSSDHNKDILGQLEQLVTDIDKLKLPDTGGSNKILEDFEKKHPIIKLHQVSLDKDTMMLNITSTESGDYLKKLHTLTQTYKFLFLFLGHYCTPKDENNIDIDLIKNICKSIQENLKMPQPQLEELPNINLESIFK